MKTTELTGAALDWAVAKCEGVPVDSPAFVWEYAASVTRYSTDWALGGPIIERESIELGRYADQWQATFYAIDGASFKTASTPLIAAMRCYVASKLGDDVDIPEELQ